MVASHYNLISECVVGWYNFWQKGYGRCSIYSNLMKRTLTINYSTEVYSLFTYSLHLTKIGKMALLLHKNELQINTKNRKTKIRKPT